MAEMQFFEKMENSYNFCCRRQELLDLETNLVFQFLASLVIEHFRTFQPLQLGKSKCLCFTDNLKVKRRLVKRGGPILWHPLVGPKLQVAQNETRVGERDFSNFASTLVGHNN